MTKRMLIDTSHPEETRVVVISGNRLEDFDYESTSRKQLKGNIYLAKVTRVEPSLQAAFVEYGGNRHGFLPFSEIHPDYYRIPIADREALLAAEVAEEVTDEADSAELDAAPDDDSDETDSAGEESPREEDAQTPAAEISAAEGPDVEEPGDTLNGAVEELPAEPKVDTLGGDDDEDAARRRANLMRRYKIQEVIKRRQVILVQVTKEERGNKGAALTTYLSLAGRYCVLMPNTAKGGGISRKIANAKDRRRLKDILEDLGIAEGIAVIVRTAGSERTKAEIRRDYEFLLRLWDEIRSTTLASTAPARIYEEANLIKRAIRDVYQSDTDEILVEGEEGYKAAKAFMKSLTPSHARKVKQYKDPAIPLFYRHQVESQIDAMHNPVVQLRSGGYIVMHMTEALVAVDVNSGKATRERHIEETAYKTNLEAAEEVARQLRLRDMAGLVVIDFIDMDESRHNRAVERKLKDAMRRDRARIQLGRISPFGLLELSRQRLRPSLLESSTEACHYCAASGYVRTVQSVALHILRALEEEGIRRGGGEIIASAPRDAALHLLNQMRDRLVAIEQRYELSVRIVTDEALIPPNYTLKRGSTAPMETAAAPERPAVEAASEDEDRSGRKRGRGRRGRKRGADTQGEETAVEVAVEREPDKTAAEASTGGDESSEESGEDKPRRRRRGKRGGRRRTRRGAEDGATAPAGDGGEAADGDTPRDVPAGTGQEDAESAVKADAATDADSPSASQEQAGNEETAPANGAAKRPRTRRRRSPRRERAPASTATEDGAEAAGVSAGGEEKSDTPRRRPARSRKPRQAETVTAMEPPQVDTAPREAVTVAVESSSPPAPDEGKDSALAEAEPKRRGWWNRWT